MMEQVNQPDLAQDLLRIHRVLTRGQTTVIVKGREFIQGGFPTPELRKGFADYVQSLVIVLEAHHLSEDMIAFPQLKKKIPGAPYARLSVNHQQIETLLDGIKEAMPALSGEGNGAALKQVISGFEAIHGIWVPHISTEEEHFSHAAVKAKFSPEEEGELSMTMAKLAQEHSVPPYLALPFVVFNLNPDDRAGMLAAMPPMVRDELIPKVWKEQWAPMKPFLLE